MGKCELYKEERDVLEMRPLHERDTGPFSALDISDKAIAIQADGGHKRRNRKGITR